MNRRAVLVLSMLTIASCASDVVPGDGGDVALVDATSDGAIAMERGPTHISSRNDTCTIRGRGDVWCWGPSMHAIPGLADAIEVEVGASEACAVRANGHVLCWTGVNNPGEVMGLADARKLAMGTGATCALRANGHVACWGEHLGGAMGAVDSAPTDVPGVDDAVEIGAGWGTVCLRRRNGTVACWGRNDLGQLGEGTQPSTTPRTVPSIANAVQIAVGATHACALNSDGSVRCWGDNTDGRLGAPAGTPQPFVVGGIGPVRLIAAGYYTTCAIVRDGRASFCWGINPYGELADGTATARNVPTAVVGVADAVAIAAGHVHTCFLRASGAVSCAGYNGEGQLGTTTTGRDSYLPVDVMGLP